jgi:AcrR family transcriptional regulator
VSAPEKRPYLAAAQRREELLAAAAEMVLSGGWRALTMKGLAEAAGVSRQLVYQHFADLSELMLAVTRHLFDRVHEATKEIAAGPASEDVTVRARRTYDVYLDLPPEQRHAMRAITTLTDVDSPELRDLRRYVRGEMLDLWTPGVRRATGLPVPQARAAAWMLTNAAWGLADLVEERAIPLESARQLLAAVAGLVLRPALRTRGRRGTLRGARRRPRKKGSPP